MKYRSHLLCATGLLLAVHASGAAFAAESATSAPADGAVPADLAGKYRCLFTQQGYEYPPFPCVIRAVGTTLELEKLAGSQRIKGSVLPTPDGFDFSGTYFCPEGDCTAKVSGHFRKTGLTRYEGVLHAPNESQDETVVKLFKSK